jgi:hypothetical protein
MDFKKPIAIFTAKSNTEAWLACHHLQTAGINACVVENNAATGFYFFGGLPGIHQPQVWVDQPDAQRANEMLKEFVELNIKRNASMPKTIEAICEKCSKTTLFSSTLVGTVQECSQCGAYLDVGDSDFTGDTEYDDQTEVEEEIF